MVAPARTLTELLDADALGDVAARLPDAAARRLLAVPVDRFGLDALTYLLRAHAAPEILVPAAIERLSDAPLLQALEFPGDLLCAVLEVPDRFWRANKPLWDTVLVLIDQSLAAVQDRAASEEREDYLPLHLGDEFMAHVLHFTSLHPRENGHG